MKRSCQPRPQPLGLVLAGASALLLSTSLLAAAEAVPRKGLELARHRLGTLVEAVRVVCESGGDRVAAPATARASELSGLAPNP